MKKIILAITFLTSLSSFADVTLNASEGQKFKGVDTVTGKKCTVQILKILNTNKKNMKVYVETTVGVESVVSVLSNIGHVFRGEENGLDNDRLFSNLYVNSKGDPLSFNLSEYYTEKTILDCDQLRK